MLIVWEWIVSISLTSITVRSVNHVKWTNIVPFSYKPNGGNSYVSKRTAIYFLLEEFFTGTQEEVLFDDDKVVNVCVLVPVQRDSSATDTEDETPQGRKKKKDKAKQHRTKGRREKKENNKALFKSKVRLIKAHNKERLKEKEIKKSELTPLVINKKVRQQQNWILPDSCSSFI